MSTRDDLEQRRAILSPSKQALLEKRLRRRLADQTIARRPDPSSAPTSFSQQRLWFLDQLEPGNAMFTIPIATRIGGDLNVALLEQCLDALIQRHETWRTTFSNQDGTPIQHIGPAYHLPLSFFDLQHVPLETREQEALQQATQQMLIPFDLAHGPLVRALLYQLNSDDYIFVLLQHHIIADGWSVGILLSEISLLYDAFAQGLPSPLPELPIQYGDYAYWQQQQLQGKALEEQLEYWQRQLVDLPPSLELPLDKKRPEQQTFHGATHRFRFPPLLAQGLRDLCRLHGVTLFMTILSALEILLYRYTGQTDMVIGTSIANRTRSELEKIVGFFVNTLILRNDLSGDPSFLALLQQVHDTSMDAYAHQEVPFERVVSKMPHLQALFIMQNAPRHTTHVANMTFERLELESHTAKFDLYLDIEDRPEILGFFEYNSDLFSAETIERLTQHFMRLLTAVVEQPERRLSEFPLLTELEAEKLRLHWGEGPHWDLPLVSLHEGFERQVLLTPRQPAVESEGRVLTYQELNAQANRLAHYLRTLGVCPETPVVLCMQRSIEQMIGVLGILKAGGCYVPLDPALPPQRLQWILTDTRAPVLLTLRSHAALGETLAGEGRRIVYLDAVQDLLLGQPETNPPPILAPEQLAYMIYTSGSTGIPKGVQVSHRSIINHSLAIQEHFSLRSHDRVLQFSSLSFDAAAEELYPTWMSGATLVLRPDYLVAPGAELHHFILQRRLTILDLPTAFWHQWASMLSRTPFPETKTLRLVIIGGEQALPEAYHEWRQRIGPGISWSNTYGPTEATVTATLYHPEPDETLPLEVVPIGGPIANAQAYILDSHLACVPPGALGELYLGGVGVARGYLQQPDITAERFLPNPYGPPGSRLYRTGDLASYLADGTIHYRGRVDQQVKIHGYRIELPEIEHVLRQHPDIDGCIVLPRRDTPDTVYLAAYCTTSTWPEPAAHTIRHYLQDRLPAYMLPACVLFVSEFPLNASGKIDVHRLPVPGTDLSLGRISEYVAPRTALEEVLASLWAGVLNVERVSVSDNFFEIGGHSLLATQLIARIQEIFPIDLPLKSLFEHPTIAHLAQMMLQDEQERETIELTVQLLQSVADLSDEEAQALFDEQQERDPGYE